MFFYTNVFQKGNYLFVRGIKDGERFQTKIRYQPIIWTNSNPQNQEAWTTLDGQSVFPRLIDSIFDCKTYVEQNSGIKGKEIYQSPGHIYAFLAETFKEEILFDFSKIAVFNIDIETDTGHRDITTDDVIQVEALDQSQRFEITVSDFEDQYDTYQFKVFDVVKKSMVAYSKSCFAFRGGFPEPSLAEEAINLITIKDIRYNQLTTFSTMKYTGKSPNLDIYSHSTETAMLKDFLMWWSDRYPDIITGWNNSLFDGTYLYNRIKLLLGESQANKLSPWRFVRQSEIDLGGRTAIKTHFAGIACLDYLDLYKKFGAYNAKESYKLESIAQEELGVGKLHFDSIDGTFRLSQGNSAVNTKKLVGKDSKDLALFEQWCVLRDQVNDEIKRRAKIG